MQRKLTAGDLSRLRELVIACAATWAEYQEPDSLKDQESDSRLYAAAAAAGGALRYASDELGRATARYYRENEL